jgi:hypothetical protein
MRMTDAMQIHLNTLLAELGGDVEAISAELERREIRGIPGAPDSCPIARYLKTRDVRVTFVSGMRITVQDDDYDTPRAVANFVRDFDFDPDAFSALVDTVEV